jgi:type I restriction-modification system DNA methylase subunit
LRRLGINRPEREQSVLGLLKDLRGLEPLKKLFWSELNYDRINQHLSRRGWNQTAANALAEDPVLFAGGGQSNDFHIVYSRLPQDRLLLGQERPVVNMLLKEHPYGLFIFSNQSQDYWHFVNVKYDTETEKRRLFRRITVSPEERLRTAAERIAMLDLQSIQPDMFGLSPLAIQSCHDEAFDVEAVTEKFFKAYKEVFENVEDCISGITNVEAKRLYAQRLFNRLMFIAFIQKKGWLKFEGKADYLSSLWSDYLKKKQDDENFYRDRLKLLFFAGLNTTNNVNIVDINRNGLINQLIGDVPYLNGGLFEEEKVDIDQNITVPDKCFRWILEKLFGSFNFTIMESTPLDVEVAVDPEMLGKIFERLVTERQKTGSYYTPKTIVSFMCREALKAYLGQCDTLVDKHDITGISIPEARSILQKLANIRICDPACGSGAYMVGMLHELQELMRLLDTKSAQTSARDNYQLKLDIIQNNLYGVDLDAFAINIARLRLWLTLAVEYEGDKPEPLPNLDFKIEVGDSLTAPDPHQGSQQVIVGELAQKLKEKTTLYMRTHYYGEKATLKKEVEELQKQIAGWVHAGVAVSGFDWAVQFLDVFSSGGFDIVLANPPYGITCEDPLRFQYFPRIRGEDTQSKDSYGLFIARGLQLLKSDGILTYIVSDTWRTIRTHRPLRQKLLQETQVMHVLDLPPWVFDATVNTCILSLRQRVSPEDHNLIAVDMRNLPAGDWNELEANFTAIATQIPDVQTTTYARYTYPQSLIKTYGNLSFFIGSPKLHNLMEDVDSFNKPGDNNSLISYEIELNSRRIKLFRFGDYYIVKGGAKCWLGIGLFKIVSGIKTGNNNKYLRLIGEKAQKVFSLVDAKYVLSMNEITKLSGHQRLHGITNEKHFVPFEMGLPSNAKGGILPCYYQTPSQIAIDWSPSAIKSMRSEPHSDLANAEFRFNDLDMQISFSTTGIYAPTFRIAVAPIFVNKASRIFLDKSNIRIIQGWLGFLNSKFARYILKNFINHSVEMEVDDLKRLPTLNNYDFLSTYVERIMINQSQNIEYDYVSNEQKEIDVLVYQQYSLTEDDIREVELWYCRRYPRLAEAQGMLAEVKQKYEEHLKRCELVMSKGPDYWKSNPVLELIAKGEGETLELKETFEVDAKTGDRNAGVLLAALKTMAAFLNTEGGTMLIGVADSGEIRGLAKDYRLCHKHDKDGFEQKIRSLVASHFTPQPTGKIKISFEQLEDKQVCLISVEKSKDIIHLDGKDVYVREGNTSRKLEGLSLTAWVKNRS